MSTQTAGLGCHEASLPQHRVLHGMSSAGQTLSQGVAHVPAERSVFVFGGRPGEKLVGVWEGAL